MKRVLPLVLVVFAAFAGCDFKVPLVDTPELPIDKAVIGLWERAKAPGETERLLVLPLSPREYLVSFIGSDGDRLYARACHCTVARIRLVQLKWFGTSAGKVPDDDRVYQFASYSVSGDNLRVRMLNTNVVDPEASSPSALAHAIGEAQQNVALFREEIAFKKVKN